MKKPLLLFFLLLFFSSFTAVPSTTEWIPTKISSKVSVAFPYHPEKQELQGRVSFTASNVTTLFQVTSVKMPDHLELTPYDIQGVLMGAVDGIIRAANGTLLTSSDFKIGHLNGKEISFQAKHPETGATMIRSAKLFIVERSLYVLHCWFLEEDQEEGTKAKRQFFESLKVKN